MTWGTHHEAPRDGAVVILQTRVSRHLEDRVTKAAAAVRGRWGDTPALCQTHVERDQVKRIRLDRIPTAAICPDCVAAARLWYAPYRFEPFDCVQRQRLLHNLTRDLDAVWRGTPSGDRP